MFIPTPTLTRRDLARLALAGTASVLLMNNVKPTQTEAAVPAPPHPNEGDALIDAVPKNAGYALSESQATEAASALKDYPGAFAKARAFALANDVEPAFASYAPAAPARKGRAR